MPKKLTLATTFSHAEVKALLEGCRVAQQTPDTAVVFRSPALRSLIAKFQRLDTKAKQHAEGTD